MSELNTDTPSADTELITQNPAQVEPGTTESGPELATGEGADPDKINQDAVQDRINKVTQKRYEAERATKAANKERDDLQTKLDAIEANKPAPTVSEMPDRFDMTDEEFNAALLKRDNERQVLADHNADQKARQTASQAAIDKQNEARQEAVNKTSDEYIKRADKFGISRDNLTKASNLVVGYGLSNDVANHIAGHENGPLIVTYLATNPEELSNLADMNPMQAAVHVSNVLSEKAAVMKPKTSNAPDPVVPLGGNGVDPDMGKYPNLKGVKYS